MRKLLKIMAKYHKGFAKIRLIMKLTTVLLMITCLKISAISYSQNSLVNVDFKSGKISSVFNAIETQTSYTIFYKDSQIDVNQEITVGKGTQTVKDLLSQLTSETKTKFEVLEKIIVITENPAAQPRFVKGIITDAETGEPLIGVTIMVEGTSQGVITDVSGYFEIEGVDANSVLLISYIGYESKSVIVGQQTEINIQLEVEARSLDEVVVIGYGALKKADITGAVSSISGDELGKYSFSSIDRALQGKLPGVTIQQDASPGGRVDIRIRGLSTISNNEPLVVIDGIPSGSLGDINPNDIASIDVLKDASAAAIYGNKASNGVIMVTTKKGKLNQKTQVRFNAEMGSSQVSKKVDVLNAEEYMMVMDEMVANGVAQGTVAAGAVKRDIAGFTPVNTDWQDEIFRTAMTQNYNLSLSGGNESTAYYFSGGIRNDEGIIINSGQKKYTLTTNFEHKLSKVFTFGENITLAYQDIDMVINHNPTGWSGTILSALTASPALPVYGSEGNFAVPFGSEGYAYYGSGNAVWTSERDGNNKKTNILGSTFLKADITDDLSFQTRYGVDYGQIFYHNYEPWRYFPTPEVEDKVTDRYSRYNSWVWDNTLNYVKSFGKHSVNLMLGSSLQKIKSDLFSASRVNLLNNTLPFQYLNFGDPEAQFNDGSGVTSALESYFGRAIYNYQDKYLLTATIRRDGSSKFVKGNKYGTFPSVAAAWRISQEDFLKSVDVIDNLKIRAGWGQVGNQSIGSNYPYLNLIETGHGYVFGPGDGAFVQGVAEVSNGNADLSWETSNMTNIGLDLGFLNRFNITLDYFKNVTTDMLLPVELPSLNGRAKAPYQNIGSVETSGFEFDLRYYLFEGDFNLTAGFNGSFIRNEVLDLGNSEFIQGSTTMANLTSNQPVMRTVVGKPISSFFGYKMEGIFQNQTEIDNHATQLEGTRPGDIKYSDINNDGVINDQDRTFLGDGFPDFTYGFSLEGNYKALDFSIFLDGNAGVKVYNGLNMYLMNTGYTGNKHTDILNYWDGEGTSNSVPRLIYNDPNNNDRISDYFIEDASYLRIKALQLGYTIPEEKLKMLGVGSVRLFLSCQNLFVITKYSGINPEVRPAGGGTNGATLEGGAGGSSSDFQRDLNIGFDTGVYPMTRTYFAGISISF